MTTGATKYRQQWEEHVKYARQQIVYGRAAKPMARVPKMAWEKISLARGIHCCPNMVYLFILPDQLLQIVKNAHIYQ